jgi:radical S-adenosyl methionine domain-containing protein 2
MVQQFKPAGTIPTAVNLHFTRACNAKCRFCYAHFHAHRDAVSPAEWAVIIERIASLGVTKVNFVGGEPTLAKDLHVMLAAAKRLGLTTSIVSNGFRLQPLLERWGHLLDWVGLSIDAADDDINEQLGRGRVVEQALMLLELARSKGCRTKINTVVTSLNVGASFDPVLRRHRPDRWKVFQVLPIAGENDDARDLFIHADAFAGYVSRHAAWDPVGEDNEDMTGSYLMVNPEGRFFDNVGGALHASDPILDIGVEAALAQVRVFTNRFVDRGGVYDWKPRDMALTARWIAVEGLDGTGKSTTVAALAERLDAVVVRNPPTSMANERAWADAQPEPERRAWYEKANQRAAEEALAAVGAGRHVVMDRSAASTAVYAAATTGTVASTWPTRVPRPDLVVALDVPEDVRRARIGVRPAWTGEERALADDAAFNARLRAGYAALCTIVDANRPMDLIVDDLLRRME